MKKTIDYKKTLGSLLLAIALIAIFSNFDLTKEFQMIVKNKRVHFPAYGLILPMFLIARLNFFYIGFSYAEGKSIFQKIVFGTLNTFLTGTLFMGGFHFWKYSNGSVDVLFGLTKRGFDLNFRNLLFWVLFQSLLLAYGLSILKIVVSKIKK